MAIVAEEMVTSLIQASENAEDTIASTVHIVLPMMLFPSSKQGDWDEIPAWIF
jgi:hypothetical protein